MPQLDMACERPPAGRFAAVPLRKGETEESEQWSILNSQFSVDENRILGIELCSDSFPNGVTHTPCLFTAHPSVRTILFS